MKGRGREHNELDDVMVEDNLGTHQCDWCDGVDNPRPVGRSRLPGCREIEAAASPHATHG